MDRLEEIKKDYPEDILLPDGPLAWLIAEVERGRLIEDAARRWSGKSPPAKPDALYDAIVDLERVLRENPRPGTEGER